MRRAVHIIALQKTVLLLGSIYQYIEADMCVHKAYIALLHQSGCVRCKFTLMW